MTDALFNAGEFAAIPALFDIDQVPTAAPAPRASQPFDGCPSCGGPSTPCTPCTEAGAVALTLDESCPCTSVGIASCRTHRFAITPEAAATLLASLRA